MKRLFFFGMIVSALMIISCGGGNQQAQQNVEDDEDSTDVYVPRDQTIYGICGNGTAMNTLQLLTDNGDTLSLAVIVINQNTLLGDWVMPNPIDGSSEVGIRIKEGGVAESIDQSSIIYKTWKIFNGKLEILSQREGGGDMEEYNLYELIMLGADSLVYKTSGVAKQDEETFEYSRWKEKPAMDLHGLKLEDSSDEFRIDN